MLYPPMLASKSVVLPVTRRTMPTRANGWPVPGTETIVDIRCNVQPILKSTDTLLIPEGDRTKKVVKVYVTDGDYLRELKEGDGGWEADRFTWQGDLYEVKKSGIYSMGVLDHCKAIAVRVELT